ncbi:MAG: LPXTG cell wall anchor domain-containing protein, partial [Firmicutes bacterium]|nr:LPXTG cell wall anchor domain-containing protein [Bacillota bacterium]
KNKPASLKFIKTNSIGDPLPGASFALYRQIKVGEVYQRDYYPMEGYEALVTTASGIVPDVDIYLKPATYYLEETEAPNGFEKADEEVMFTITADGYVTVSTSSAVSFDKIVSSSAISNEVRIVNERKQKLSFKKVGQGNISTGLEGAVFDFYSVDEHGNRTRIASNLASGPDGLLIGSGNKTVFELAVGDYELVETKPPEGFLLKNTPVTISVTTALTTDAAVVYNEGTTLSSSGAGKQYDGDTNVYTLLITNSTGYAFPSTGGIGTGLYTGIGILLMLGSVSILVYRRKKGRQ